MTTSAMALHQTQTELDEAKKDARALKKITPKHVGRGLSSAITLGSGAALGALDAVREDYLPSVPPLLVEGIVATGSLSLAAVTDDPDLAEAASAAGRAAGAVAAYGMSKAGTKAGIAKMKAALPAAQAAAAAAATGSKAK